MSLKIDRVQLDIIINNDPARQKMAELENDYRKLAKEQKKYAEGSADWNRIKQQMIGVKQQMDKVYDSIGLNNLSLKELSKRQKELNLILSQMGPNIKGYAELKAQADAVGNRILELKGKAKDTGLSIGKIADGFNKYFAIATAGVASLAGLVFSLRKTVEVANEFEKRADNLSALTGLMGRDLEYLKKQALELSTATIEGNVRITASATEILDAYTKVGSKRPDLLKVKEDLNAVTQEAMILAAAADGELQPAVDGLTMVLNQFNLPASESRRIINVLAAGSKEGAGEVDYLTAAFEKSGSVASSFGVSIEDLTGVIETLAPRMSEPEMAGRNLRNIMIKLETDANEKLHPSLVGLGQALKNLADEQLSVVEMEKMFGAENINAANILISNTAETDKYTKAVTGTNVALEQAAINTDNNATKLAQARNEIQKTYIEFGQKLAPAMTFSTNTFNAFLRVLMGAPQFVKQYNMALIALGTVLLAYNANLAKSTALKVIDFVWSKNLVAQYIRNNIVLNAMVTWEKLRAIWTTNATVATKLATSAQTAWNAVLLANPIGVVIAAIGALVLAIKGYDQYNAESIRLEREKTLAIQSVKKANDDLSVTLENQKTIISVLNRLTMEEKKAKLESFDATIKLAEAELQLAKAKQLNIEKENTRATLWQQVKNHFMAGNILSLNNLPEEVLRNKKDAENNGKEAADEMNEAIAQMEDNLKTLRSNSSIISNMINAEADADAIKLQTVEALEEKQRLYNDALKSYAIGSEDYIRIQKKLGEVNKQLSSDLSGPSGPASHAQVLNDAFTELNKKIAEYDRLINNAAAAGDSALVKSLIDQRNVARDLLQTYKDLILQVENGVDITKAINNVASKGMPDGAKQSFQNAIDKFKGKGSGATNVTGPSQENQDEEAQAADIRQRIRDAAIQSAEYVNDAIFSSVKNRYEKELNLALNSNEKLRENDLKNKKLTEEEKQKINDEYNAKAKALKVEAFRKQLRADEWQAGINGALAITKTFAQYGFTPQGIIAAAAQAIATGTQIATISSTPIPEFYGGRYDVTGANTGKTYRNIEYVGKPKTGIYTHPSIISDSGAEMIIDAETTKRLQMNYPAVIQAINYARAPEYAAGRYTSSTTSGSPAAAPVQVISFDAETLRIMNEHTQMMQKMVDKGVKGKWNLYDLEDIQDKKKSIEQSTAL